MLSAASSWRFWPASATRTTLAALAAVDHGACRRWRFFTTASSATWAGPILMGLCRFLNVLLGLSIYGGPMPSWGLPLAPVVGVYIAGVTWFARNEARESNQNSLIAAAMVMLAGLLLAPAIPALSCKSPWTRRFRRSRPFFPLRARPFRRLGFAVCAIQRLRSARADGGRAIRLVVLDALASVRRQFWAALAAVDSGTLFWGWLYST